MSDCPHVPKCLMLDRIDLHLEVPAQPPERLHKGQPGEASTPVRARVEAARARMIARQGCANALLGPRALFKHLHADPGALDLLDQAAQELGFSARAYDRILKVARTIADLEGRDEVKVDDVAEAVGYRVLDRAA